MEGEGPVIVAFSPNQDIKLDLLKENFFMSTQGQAAQLTLQFIFLRFEHKKLVTAPTLTSLCQTEDTTFYIFSMMQPGSKPNSSLTENFNKVI